MQNRALRLWVTGANGFVAGSVIKQAPVEWEIHVLSRGDILPYRTGLHSHRFEAQDAARLAEIFNFARPDAVIHTASLADIDYCEAHPAEAQVVNAELTRRLAELCAVHNAKLVFCSTDTIFDGEHAPYGEDALPGPLNAYARTKVAAEQAVEEAASRFAIARLALVIGLPVLGAGNTFLPKWLATLRAGRQLEVPAREVRTPIDVITAGRGLLELASGPVSGKIHLAGNESLTRLDMARRVAKRFGLPQELVVPVDPAKMADRAPRPRDVSLNNRQARASLRTPMINLDEALTLTLENQEQL